MIGAEILKPLAVLAAWTMVMWLWMYATRIPAINKLPKSDAPGADQGWTSAKLEAELDPKIQWKAHNYNHLHEAPTVFYAVALALAMRSKASRSPGPAARNSSCCGFMVVGLPVGLGLQRQLSSALLAKRLPAGCVLHAVCAQSGRDRHC